MSYEDLDESRKRGSPVNLFLFTYGPGETDYYAYTDAERSITHDDVVYEPAPIERGNLRSSGNLDKAALEIESARDIALAELFRVYPPSQVVTVIILEGHTLDPDGEYVVVWTGRVINAERKNSRAVYTCESVATSMRRPGLRRHYQYMCPHYLYGPQCRANKAAATVAGTVSAVTGAVVTLTDGWETAERKALYVGGMLEWTGDDDQAEMRTILTVVGNVLTLSGIARGLAISDAVSVVRGCDHKMTGCNLHSNINNYGGMPWIPTKNPLSTTNNFG